MIVPVALALGLSLSAQAEPHNATQAEQDEIMAHVRQGLEARNSFLSLKEAETLRRAHALVSAISLHNPELQDSWARAHNGSREAEKEMVEHFSKAIHLAQRYYGIPTEISGSVNAGFFKGKRLAGYSPVFSEREFHLAIDGKGVTHYFRDSKRPDTVMGITLDDGTVLVKAGAFLACAESNSPRQLALTLYHEFSHASGLTGDEAKASAEQREHRALSAEISVGRVLGVTPGEEKALQSQLLTAARKIDNARRYKAPLSRAFHSDTEDEANEEAFMASQAKVGAIRQEQAKLKREVDLRQHAEALRALAAGACAKAVPPAQAELDSVGFLPAEAYGQLALPATAAPAAPVAPAADCAERLFARMLDELRSGRRPDAAWFAAELARVQPAAPR